MTATLPPPPPPGGGGVAVPINDDDDDENDERGERSRATPPPKQHQRYGADNLTRREFALIQLALVVGSSIEWFDFSVYGALASVITPLFFPPPAAGGDGATQALYFWGVFALSFVSRPIGSLFLGSIGDRYGRRPALLLSLAGMAVPTVLIGCLPTYAQAGVAAPILLALLRLIQGLAMGAEFSSALVYSVELSPRGKKGVFGSLTFQAGGIGIALGNAAVMVLTAALSPQQLSVWGWRLPFLLTAFSALGAFALRMRMPEPRAWEAVAVVPEVVVVEEEKEEEQKAGGGGGSKAAGLPLTTNKAQKGRRKQRPPKQTTQKQTQGVPVFKLLRTSWIQVVLQTLLEAFGAVCFYTAALWLPSWHKSSGLMGAEAAGGATIAALVAMAITSMFGGWCADALRTPRKTLLAAAATFAAGAAVAVPGFLGIASLASNGAVSGPSQQAAAALFQALMLALAGFGLGVVPSLCARLYAPDVRVVSYSLAHNLAMSLLGGTAPLVIAAMAPTPAGKKGAAPGIYIVAAGVASLGAALALAVWSKAMFVAADEDGGGGEEEAEVVAEAYV